MAGANVWMKCGFVRNMLPQTNYQTIGQGTQTTTGVGGWIYKDSPNSSFQAIVQGTGAVGATVLIEVSNDGINPNTTPLGTITLTGTTVSADGLTSSNASWKWVRANVTAISGTGATIQTVMGT